ncbi:hypothetical protein ACWEWU_10860 [Staphylococcus xylosus]
MKIVLKASAILIAVYSVKELIEKRNLNKLKGKDRALQAICEDTLFTLFKRIQKNNNPELIEETTGLLKLFLDKS